MLMKFMLLLISLLQTTSILVIKEKTINEEKISNVNSSTSEKHYSPSNQNPYLCLANNEKVYLYQNEPLIISYDYISNLEYTITTSGCNLIKDTHNSEEKNIYLNIQYIGKEGNICLKVNDDLNIKIYFIKYEDRIFRSTTSNEDVLRNLYGTLLDEEKITEKDYTQFIRTLYQPSVTHTKMNRVQAKSSTPGLLYGTFSYQDDYGINIPIRFSKVEILDEDINFDDTLAVVYTDENGYFEFQLKKTTENIFGNGYDIYIKLYAHGSNTEVVDGSKHAYFYVSDVNKDIPKDFTKDFSMTIMPYINNDNKNKELEIDSCRRAFSISQSAIMSARFANYLNNGYDITECKLHYPYEDSTCFYSYNNIYICNTYKKKEDYLPEVYASWDTIGHEYGHHVQACFDISSNSYLNDHSHNLSMYELEGVDNSNIDYYRKEGIRVAYAEGWATVFGILSQKYNSQYLKDIRFTGDNSYTADNNVDFDLSEYSILKGESCEGGIAQFMFHLWDTDNDDIDIFSLTYKEWYHLSTYGNPTTFSAFIDNCYEYGFDKFELGKLLSAFHFSASNLWIRMGGYLDEVPTFTWNVNGGSMKLPNNLFDLVFLTPNNIEILRITNIHTEDSYRTSYTLTKNQWARILAATGKSYFVYIISRCDKYITTGPYYSEQFIFEKPTEFYHKSQIKANEWGFEPQYYFETNKAGHETTTIYKNGLTITTNRLRCGYIEDSYVVLSPRRQNAGKAYLELTFDKPVYSYLFGITLWSKNEGINDDYTAVIEELDSEGNWHVSWDLMNDLPNGFSTKDQQVDRYESICSEGIYGLRFVVTSPAVGDRNKGRLCIEDIVLNTDPNDLYFITKYY